jgi:Spy/CpxP family protein refolding chaperone
MSFLMTLTAAERDVILALRQKSGKHTFFNDDGAEVAAPKKRELTEEQKAKMKAGREAARAKKLAESAAEAALPAEVPAAAAPAEKPKRVLSEEQKAKMKAGREAARAKKLEKELAERQALRDLEPHVAPATYLAMLAEAPVPSPALLKAVRSQLPADASVEMKELWEKTNQELRDIYHPLVGKKVGMRTSAGLPDKLALVTAITRLRAAGHTPENPAKTVKAE